MDELLKNIWTAEETQSMASTSNFGIPNNANIRRQGSLTLPRTLSRKSVDEREQREPTLGDDDDDRRDRGRRWRYRWQKSKEMVSEEGNWTRVRDGVDRGSELTTDEEGVDSEAMRVAPVGRTQRNTPLFRENVLVSVVEEVAGDVGLKQIDVSSFNESTDNRRIPTDSNDASSFRASCVRLE
ncbi:hypothetical protein LXL04_010551 [Taraxacum kok-saghyz]